MDAVVASYTKKIENVFVNGVAIPPELYVIKTNGTLEFTKPLIEIAPNAKVDADGKRVFWVVIDYEYKESANETA